MKRVQKKEISIFHKNISITQLNSVGKKVL